MSNFDGKSESGKSSSKSSKIKNLEELIKAAAAKREDEINPERKLLFRPKIYESWKEGDEEDVLEVRQRLLTDIAKKQMLLADKKSFVEVDEDEDEEESQEKTHLQDTILRLKNRKQREAAFKKKIEMYELKTKEERLRKEQEIFESERSNPSKYGCFYGDGYYEGSGYFGIKEELIEQLAEEGEEWNEKWLQKYPETFTEKFLRHFWAPKLLLKNKFFRTRGSYLDFPEVIADWPKPIDITYNRSKVEMLSSSLPIFTPNEDGELMEISMVNEFLRKAEAAIAAQEAEEAEELKQQEEMEKIEEEKQLFEESRKRSGVSIFGQRGKVGPKKELGSDEWYYDDEFGEFFPKKLGFEVEYHFDGHVSVWRKKRKTAKYEALTSPYDYYWDPETGTFLLRADYTGVFAIAYDESLSIYKLTKVVKQKVGDKSVRVVANDDTAENKISDFYYDESSSKWELKKNAGDGASDIAWDENGKRFARKAEGTWRGLTGCSPDDYYFDDMAAKFIPKPPRQGNNFKYFSEDGVWKKSNPSQGQKSRKNVKSSDYYFDLMEGQFKIREIGRASRYKLQKYAKIYFKAQEPKSGLFPEDYYWDPRRKLWLPRQIRMEMLQNARSGVPIRSDKIKGRSGQQENFFWDSEEGEFFKKEPNENYYKDEEAGVWLSEKLKNKLRNRKYPGDFFWNENKKMFLIKDAKAGDGAYTYDEKEGVWKLPGSKNDGNPRPKDFVFSADTQKWLPIGEADAAKPNETNGTANVKKSAVKTPDDFWYSDSEGRFYPKTSADAATYYFSAADGVWKKKGVSGPPATGFLPKNFFFDDYKFCYKLKVAGMDSDYYYDKNNKIYRHITNTGKTRNGLVPSDYKWNNELGLYILTKGTDKNRGGVFSEDLKWDPLRDYDKPWIGPSPTSTATSASASATTTKSQRLPLNKK